MILIPCAVATQQPGLALQFLSVIVSIYMPISCLAMTHALVALVPATATTTALSCTAMTNAFVALVATTTAPLPQSTADPSPDPSLLLLVLPLSSFPLVPDVILLGSSARPGIRGWAKIALCHGRQA